MLCDSHCHLNFSQFEGELDKVIEQINKEPMLIINVGTCYLTSIKAIEVSRKSPFFFASIGLHPSHVNLYFKDSKEILSEKDLLPSEKFDEKFEDLLTEKKVVAVGEAGLDFKYLEIFKNEKEKSEAIERQIEEFKKQIQKAKDFHLPLIIHVRELYEKALEILEE
jgi:Mg-dependent DNase